MKINYLLKYKEKTQWSKFPIAITFIKTLSDIGEIIHKQKM